MTATLGILLRLATFGILIAMSAGFFVSGYVTGYFAGWREAIGRDALTLRQSLPALGTATSSAPPYGRTEISADN